MTVNGNRKKYYPPRVISEALAVIPAQAGIQCYSRQRGRKYLYRRTRSLLDPGLRRDDKANFEELSTVESKKWPFKAQSKQIKH